MGRVVSGWMISHVYSVLLSSRIYAVMSTLYRHGGGGHHIDT